MPAEPNDPVVLVPLEAADHPSSIGENPHGTARPRKSWWLVAIVAGVLLAAAVAVNSQLGTDPVADEDTPEGDEAADGANESLPDEQATPDDAPVDTAAPDRIDQAAADDEPADVDDGPSEDASDELFEEPPEPEVPDSDVEPYVPSRVRLNEPGPPAEFCTRTLLASRIQLPLRFASTKPEGVDQLTWAPDCRRIVFRVGSSLWVADGDGTADMPFLTAQHGLSAPTWSPDGEWIAFSRNAIVEGDRASHIHIVRPDALGLSQLTDGVVLDKDPAWSPDGTHIAFTRRTRVANGTDVGEFDQYIVVVDVATGSEQVLSAGGEHESSPSWTYDGEAVGYRVGSSLMVSHPGGPSELEFLVDVVGRGASWSPDGSRVAAWCDWSDGRASIMLRLRKGPPVCIQQWIETDGQGQTSAANAPTLQWSADSERLFFHSPDGRGGHWAYSVEVASLARSEEYWATATAVDRATEAAGYEVLDFEHSLDPQAGFFLRGQTGDTIVEIAIAFDRSQPDDSFETVDNPHSELAGISRDQGRIGVWFSCGDLYGEVLATSLSAADTLAAQVLAAACGDN